MSNSSGDEISGNPIGRLQELCILRRWTPPIYETDTEIGQPHNKNFVMACKVAQFREVGEGTSKKIAKRRAAYKMLRFLTSESNDADLESNCMAKFADIKDVGFKKINASNKREFEQTFKKIRADNTEGARELHVSL